MTGINFSYRRPASVPSSRGSAKSSDAGSEKAPSLDGSTTSARCSIRGIPEQLSFDRIISGGTCPPCTKRDFFNYLKYIELGAENLLFYLWYLDYEKRFNQLPESERVLAPEWTEAQAAKEVAAYRARVKNRAAAAINDDKQMVEMMKPLDDANTTPESEKVSPFAGYEDARMASMDTAVERPMSATPSQAPTAATAQSGKTLYSLKTQQTFENAGLKWQPFTIQPYREEMSRIITTYLTDKAPRQLNLAAKDLAATLHALEVTTHPTAFRNVIKTVEATLRDQSHPNFIRWTICNGNRPRVIFARGLGVFLIIAGLLLGILLCLSKAGRAWRVMTLLPLALGISTLIAAYKGMCVVLHGLHHRHLRPWELFEGDDVKSLADSDFEESSSVGSLSFEDEPWVAKYSKRFFIRKIFDREIWIEEPMLRQIQDMIFFQSLAAAFVIGGIITGVFCAVPKGNLF